jgi:metal-sulfur cluster biosynthetic enzyme
MTTASDPGRPPASGAPLTERVREALRRVIDPEIGVNIVDLGLVYRIEALDGDVRVELTMTTPACPLHEYLATKATEAIRSEVPTVGEVSISLVWDPPWHADMMSEEARHQLGIG